MGWITLTYNTRRGSIAKCPRSTMKANNYANNMFYLDLFSVPISRYFTTKNLHSVVKSSYPVLVVLFLLLVRVLCRRYASRTESKLWPLFFARVWSIWTGWVPYWARRCKYVCDSSKLQLARVYLRLARSYVTRPWVSIRLAGVLVVRVSHDRSSTPHKVVRLPATLLSGFATITEQLIA